jgi:hypothetical protein
MSVARALRLRTSFGAKSIFLYLVHCFAPCSILVAFYTSHHALLVLCLITNISLPYNIFP